MGTPDPYGSQLSDNTPQVIVDEASETVVYVGFAANGVATSEAKWLIQKTEITGNITLTQWADGGNKHDQIWDNRASLTYS